VNNLVLIELKAVDTICVAHIAQLQNYLKATTIEVGIILNFGPKPEFKRKYLTNDRKEIKRQSIF
jgi:GxxExxY protein